MSEKNPLEQPQPEGDSPKENKPRVPIRPDTGEKILRSPRDLLIIKREAEIASATKSDEAKNKENDEGQKLAFQEKLIPLNLKRLQIGSSYSLNYLEYKFGIRVSQGLIKLLKEKSKWKKSEEEGKFVLEDIYPGQEPVSENLDTIEKPDLEETAKGIYKDPELENKLFSVIGRKTFARTKLLRYLTTIYKRNSKGAIKFLIDFLERDGVIVKVGHGTSGRGFPIFQLRAALGEGAKTNPAITPERPALTDKERAFYNRLLGGTINFHTGDGYMQRAGTDGPLYIKFNSTNCSLEDFTNLVAKGYLKRMVNLENQSPQIISFIKI